jgi:hypothetical protein
MHGDWGVGFKETARLGTVRTTNQHNESGTRGTYSPPGHGSVAAVVTAPHEQKKNKKEKQGNNEKLPSQTKLPLTMEVRCTRQLCVRAAGGRVWRGSLVVLLGWSCTLLDGQHVDGGPPLSPCDSCHTCPMPDAHRPLSFVLTDSSVTPHPRVLVLCCTTPHFPVSALLPCA